MSLQYLILLLCYLLSDNYHCMALKNIACERKSSCVCVYENGEEINLTPFNVSATNPNFLFASNATVAYLYQPCLDQPLGNNTEKAVLWKYMAASDIRNATFPPLTLDDVLNDLKRPNGTNSTWVPLGTGDTALFTDTERNINQAKITYIKNDQYTSVNLVCNLYDPTTLAIGEPTPPMKNNLILTSAVVCPEVFSEGGLSGGAVFFIIIFTFALAYLVGGMLYKKFVVGATGVEMIPNLEFWAKLGTSIRNFFACSNVTPPTYESI